MGQRSTSRGRRQEAKEDRQPHQKQTQQSRRRRAHTQPPGGGARGLKSAGKPKVQEATRQRATGQRSTSRGRRQEAKEGRQPQQKQTQQSRRRRAHTQPPGGGARGLKSAGKPKVQAATRQRATGQHSTSGGGLHATEAGQPGIPYKHTDPGQSKQAAKPQRTSRHNS